MGVVTSPKKTPRCYKKRDATFPIQKHPAVILNRTLHGQLKKHPVVIKKRDAACLSEKSMQTIVYKYYLKPPTENADRVLEQMHLAHLYQNRLIEIYRNFRNKYSEARSSVDSQILTLEVSYFEQKATVDNLREEIKKLRSLANLKRLKKEPTDDIKARIAELTSELKPLKEQTKQTYANLKSARLAAKTNPRLLELAQELNTQRTSEIKAARAEFSARGLYWGTYLQAEDAVDRANKTSFPEFKKWLNGRRSCLIAVQCQGGLPSSEVFGKDTRVQVGYLPPEQWSTRPGRRAAKTTLSLRVGSNPDRSPIWAKFPMLMHRQLPQGSIIKEVKVTRRWTRRLPDWEVHFVIQVESYRPKSPHAEGFVAIDIGTGRQMEDGSLRIGYILDEQDCEKEILLPPRLLYRFQKSDELRSIRDKNFNEILPKAAAWLKENEGILPEEFSLETQNFAQWRSKTRLATLTLNLRTKRFPGDDDLFELLETWRYRDQHLQDYEEGCRKGGLNGRREIYRVLASQLAQTYETVALKDCDFAKQARRAQTENKDKDLPEIARHNRMVAAPGELRDALKLAFSGRVMVEQAGTTRNCSVCGNNEPWENVEELMHTCTNCGETFDRDWNACVNMLRKAKNAQD